MSLFIINDAVQSCVHRDDNNTSSSNIAALIWSGCSMSPAAIPLILEILLITNNREGSSDAHYPNVSNKNRHTTFTC